MTNLDGTRLLTPRKEEEIYPYRRVWRSLVLENGILAGVMVVLFVAYNFLGIRLLEQFNMQLGILLAILPAILWVLFSYLPEHRVIDPRESLLIVFIISMLVANAIGIPFVTYTLKVDEWLPLSSAIRRIVGYTITVGIVQEGLKYLIVHYIAWPTLFRNRYDSIAYCVASAVGYATVINLHFAANNVASPDMLMLRFFTVVAMNTVASVIVAYGLSETLFSHTLPFLLPVTLIFAAAVNGIALPLRSSLMNAGLNLTDLTVVTTKPYMSLGFALALLILPMMVLSFIFDLADRHEREAAISRD